MLERSRRPKFSSPPPAPNLSHLHSYDSRASLNRPTPPLPPPPKSWSPAISVSSSSASGKYQQSQSPNQGADSAFAKSKSVSVSEALEEGDDMDGGKPKLKALHWDKVRATSDRATVWDQLKSSSFQLNEDMMETLFGCKSINSAPKPKETTVTRKPVFPPVEQDNRVLDPNKSQNIAILLRALNVTRDEVSEALLDAKGANVTLLYFLNFLMPLIFKC